MAMGSGGSGGGLSSDINVTPMIDVLLVLLIIFMITLPLSRREFDVQVPAEQKQKPTQSDQIVLELAPDGSYSINRQPVTFDQLDAKFHELYDQRPAKLLFIKSAPNRKYGDIVRAMDVARGAGVQVIGFTPAEQGAAA